MQRRKERSTAKPLLREWEKVVGYQPRDIQRCPYCKGKSEKVRGKVIYPQKPALWDLEYYVCKGCAAWVGCHKETGYALGTLANADLRRMRQITHHWLDKLWTTPTQRTEIYSWLALNLRLARRKCHVAMFNMNTCKQTIELCKERLDVDERVSLLDQIRKPIDKDRSKVRWDFLTGTRK